MQFLSGTILRHDLVDVHQLRRVRHRNSEVFLDHVDLCLMILWLVLLGSGYWMVSGAP